MLSKINNIKRTFVSPIFFFALTIFFLMVPLKFFPGSDDISTFNIFAEKGLWATFLEMLAWQPRLSNLIVWALMHFNLPLWKVVTTLHVALTCFTMSETIGLNMRTVDTFSISRTICICYFFMYPPVLTSAVFWYSGSFQYAYPALYMFVALIPFYYALCGTDNLNKLVGILAIICAGMAAYTEQEAAVLFCFGIITVLFLLIRKEHVSRWILVEMFIILINLGVYFYLGGQKTRMIAEVRWFPTFPMLSNVEKLYQGINWANYQLLNASNVLFFTLTLLLFFVYYLREDNTHATKALTAIPAFFVALNIIPLDVLLQKVAYNESSQYKNLGVTLCRGLAVIFNAAHEKPGDINDFNLDIVHMLPGIICLTITLFTGGLLFFAYKNRKESFANVLLFFAALSASYVMGFSPVLYEAGNRVFYITNLLLIFIIGTLVKEISCEIKNEKKKKRFFSIFLMLAGCVAILFIMEHTLFNYSNGVRY